MATLEALTRYKAKRNFSITPEPAEGGESATDRLSFVIQKHWASSLHYDFRLELDGAMKSWAVPKGPSLDPKTKRMAVQVEDHPIAYSSFEGSIPARQYGAGKVIVWDKGGWVPQGDPRQGLREGNLKFELQGHKLRGTWMLVRMKARPDAKPGKQEAWLLIKEKDDFARPAAEFSVVDEMPDSVAAVPRLSSGLPPGATPAALPASLAPQLASLADRPPANPQDWLFEIKFDGYRLLTRIDAADIRLFTRNGLDWTHRLLPLKQAIAKLKLPAGWYDGELVLPDAHGVPDFGALQQAFDSAQSDVFADRAVLYLFDLPFFDGHDLRAVALEARRAVLKRVLDGAPSELLRFSEAFDAPPQSVLASACKLGLEGLIAKRRDSTYVSRRSTDWIKLKCGQRQEFVIGGYTDPRGARTGIGSLLLGVHDDAGRLRYAGNVGTGFDQGALTGLRTRLDALRTGKSPFGASAAIAGKPNWVEPTLVAEVSFSDWTRSGRIRHSVFQGLRTDKEARLIMREKAQSVAEVGSQGSAAAPLPAPGPKPLSAGLRITHPDRVIDAASGTTKIELVRYYALVGDLMMLHLKGRPVSLLRAPSGVGGELFFQKHATTEKLPGIRQLDPALFISHPPMLEVVSKQGLLSAAQWNAVEFHTLNTGTKSLEHPDRMVFDLDPGAGVGWPQIQEAAELVRAFLMQLGLAAFLKTSGGKGLHVLVPLRKVHDWDTVKGFSQAVVAHLAKTIPQRFVHTSGPKNRVGKIFIDYLRNGLGASTVCAWSARARPGLGISVPVAWRELASVKGGDHWTVKTAHSRLDQGNAPWAGYAKSARSLAAAMKLLGYSAADTGRGKGGT